MGYAGSFTPVGRIRILSQPVGLFLLFEFVDCRAAGVMDRRGVEGAAVVMAGIIGGRDFTRTGDVAPPNRTVF